MVSFKLSLNICEALAGLFVRTVSLSRVALRWLTRSLEALAELATRGLAMIFSKRDWRNPNSCFHIPFTLEESACEQDTMKSFESRLTLTYILYCIIFIHRECTHGCMDCRVSTVLIPFKEAKMVATMIVNTWICSYACPKQIDTDIYTIYV